MSNLIAASIIYAGTVVAWAIGGLNGRIVGPVQDIARLARRVEEGGFTGHKRQDGALPRQLQDGAHPDQGTLGLGPVK